MWPPTWNCRRFVTAGFATSAWHPTGVNLSTWITNASMVRSSQSATPSRPALWNWFRTRSPTIACACYSTWGSVAAITSHTRTERTRLCSSERRFSTSCSISFTHRLTRISRRIIRRGNSVAEKDKVKLICGSLGNSDISQVWQDYYDSIEVYSQLQQIKLKIGPDDSFSTELTVLSAAST